MLLGYDIAIQALNYYIALFCQHYSFKKHYLLINYASNSSKSAIFFYYGAAWGLPLTLPRCGVAGDNGVTDEGDEEGVGHTSRAVGYVAHQHGGYGATYYRHNEQGGSKFGLGSRIS